MPTRPQVKLKPGTPVCPSCGQWDSVASVQRRKGEEALYQECLECGTLWHSFPPDSRVGRLATRYIEERRGKGKRVV